jgi:hypothetical protein
MGENIRPPVRWGSARIAGLKPGYHPDRRPEFRFRILDEAKRVYGEEVGGFAATIIEGMWRRQISATVGRALLNKLLPEKLPANLTSLPATMDSAADWLASVSELRRLRREGFLNDEEWLTALRAETETFRAVQEAKALIKAGS